MKNKKIVSMIMSLTLAVSMFAGMAVSAYASVSEKEPEKVLIKAHYGARIVSQTEKDVGDNLYVITTVEEPLVRSGTIVERTIGEHWVRKENFEVVEILGSMYIAANFTYDPSQKSISLDFWNYSYHDRGISTYILQAENLIYDENGVWEGKRYAKYEVKYLPRISGVSSSARTMFIKCDSDGNITNSKDGKEYQ